VEDEGAPLVLFKLLVNSIFDFHHLQIVLAGLVLQQRLQLPVLALQLRQLRLALPQALARQRPPPPRHLLNQPSVVLHQSRQQLVHLVVDLQPLPFAQQRFEGLVGLVYLLQELPALPFHLYLQSAHYLADFSLETEGCGLDGLVDGAQSLNTLLVKQFGVGLLLVGPIIHF
jgi:hypothetical protein